MRLKRFCKHGDLHDLTRRGPNAPAEDPMRPTRLNAPNDPMRLSTALTDPMRSTTQSMRPPTQCTRRPNAPTNGPMRATTQCAHRPNADQAVSVVPHFREQANTTSVPWMGQPIDRSSTRTRTRHPVRPPVVRGGWRGQPSDFGHVSLDLD